MGSDSESAVQGNGQLNLRIFRGSVEGEGREMVDIDDNF